MRDRSLGRALQRRARRLCQSRDAGVLPRLRVGRGQQDAVAAVEEGHALGLVAHLDALLERELHAVTRAGDPHPVREQAALDAALVAETLDVHVEQASVLDAAQAAQAIDTA